MIATEHLGGLERDMLKLPSLTPGQYFHIYQRGNNRESIFLEERNYAYFLTLYSRHVAPVADTFAYCLMPNHFHLLVRIRAAAAANAPTVSAERAFANLLNAYAKSINKAYGRVGAVFQHRFGRIRVDSDRYFVALIGYIHRNPQKHGFVDDFRGYAHSSYGELVSQTSDVLKTSEVLAWFDGMDGFVRYHHDLADWKPIAHLIADDGD
jgi:putative transposase